MLEYLYITEQIRLQIKNRGNKFTYCMAGNFDGNYVWEISGNSDFLKAKPQVCVLVEHITYYYNNIMYRTVHHTHTILL